VHNAGAEREMVLMCWGMPPSELESLRRSRPSSALAAIFQPKKAADFSYGLLCSICQNSVAFANTHTDTGSAKADTATVLVVVPAAFDVSLTGSVVVRITFTDDDAALTALTPATAIFIADHSDVLDVAVRQGGYAVRERGGIGSCSEKRTCANTEVFAPPRPPQGWPALLALVRRFPPFEGGSGKAK